MLYEGITNFNFNEIEDYMCPHPKTYDRLCGYNRVGNDIVFETNYVACPCIYWIKQDDLFCFSFDVDTVVEFAKLNNIQLSDDYENFKKLSQNIKAHLKPSIKRRYKYNLNYIENWKRVTLHSNGEFEVIKNDFVPFTLNLKDNFEEFNEFIDKYKKIINDTIDEGLFLPTITGGLDTRGFIGLYRDRINELDGYFLTEVKQDGKNHVEQGQLELKLAEQVVKKIGLKNHRVNKLEDEIIPYITMTGMFNENAELCEQPNDPDYIYKVIQHGYDNTHQYINKITPFMSNEYLQFKQSGTLFKMVILLMYADDLLCIPFISGASLFRHFPNGCSLYPTFKDNLKAAQDIINHWKVRVSKNFITKSDFDIYKDKQMIYGYRNPANQEFKITKEGNDIVFTSNFLSCPRIAYCKVKNDFIFDTTTDNILIFVRNNYSDVWNKSLEEPYCNFKESVKDDYRINHIKFIENWSKIIVHKDGTFEKINYPLVPYSVELKDAYDLVHNWLIKYKKIVSMLINKKRFIPTLTGGMDTRCFTALYRGNDLDYYLKDVKPDGKNNLLVGKADADCANEVAKAIGLKNQMRKIPTGYFTLSGLFSGGCKGSYGLGINNVDYIYKFIQHHKWSIVSLKPYSDDLFLQIKQPRDTIFRCLMCLILCPDLLDYKFVGTTQQFIDNNNSAYDFYVEYKDYIDDTKAILDYWGEDKVSKILEE